MRNVCFEKYSGKFMSEGVFLLLIVHLVTLQRLVSCPKNTFFPMWGGGGGKDCGFPAESSDL